MGYRAYVQVKHEIKYGDCYFNWANDRIHDWLTSNGVDVSGGGECGELPEWEMSKEQLRAIPEEAYRDLPRDGELDCEITAQDLRNFVDDLLAAPTGEWAYVTWL